VYAREYVRPVCLAYITRDSKKIMEYFHEFLGKFTKVTKVSM
jgi:hypothetical protein